jgi:hypothetical protein
MVQTLKSDSFSIVTGCHLITGCEYAYNIYDDGRDVGFFMCNDRINALLVESITREAALDALVGCQDKVIRLLQVGGGGGGDDDDR